LISTDIPNAEPDRRNLAGWNKFDKAKTPSVSEVAADNS
jgi:hypothetical protein